MIDLIIMESKNLLIAPLSNWDALWALLPVYFNWFFNEVFFEKERTKFQNIFSNGFSAIWISLNWIKHILPEMNYSFNWTLKIILSIFMLIYGLLIMIKSAKGEKIVVYIGRFREISFFSILITPFIFNLVKINIYTVFGAFLLFMCIWILLWILHKIIPQFPGEEEPNN